MNLVESSALYLNYSASKINRITSLLEYAASAYGYNTNEYNKYISENTYGNDIDLVQIVTENMFTEYKNVSGSHDYRGVTIYKNPDRTYSCPELGIYSINGSAQIKQMVKDKKATKEQVKENCELVVNNIFTQYHTLTESNFIEYVLEYITEDAYTEFGGKYFKDFVGAVNDISGNYQNIPNSLISEGYELDEGIGDFVRNVGNKAVNAVHNGVDRHTAAQAKLGAKIANSGKGISAVGDKVKSAVGKTFTKDNFRKAGAVVNATADSFNKLASNVAGGAVVAAKTFDNINTDALEYKRAEMRAKNVEDPKAKIDREAEAAPQNKPVDQQKKKKPTSKELEAKYDEVMKSESIEYVKNWLDDSGIFDDADAVDDYIMNEMTSEDMLLILGEADLSESAASIAKQKAKMQKLDAKAKERKAKSIARTEIDDINSSRQDALVTTSKSYNKPLGKAIAPPKDRNALVPTSKSYNKPLGYAIAPPVNTRKRPSGYMTNNPMPQAVPPQKPSRPAPMADYRGYTSNGRFTSLNTDNLATTKSGSPQSVKTAVKKSLGDNNTKPSNIISRFADNTKKYAKKLFSKFNPIKESVVLNWLSEEELINVTCWLIESTEFDYESDLLEYLNEYMTWDDVHSILETVEDETLDIIIECFYDEYENSGDILDALYESIGAEYYEYILEGMDGDDEYDTTVNNKAKKKEKNVVKMNPSIAVNESTCTCTKGTKCAKCKKLAWKDKLYNKVKK